MKLPKSAVAILLVLLSAQVVAAVFIVGSNTIQVTQETYIALTVTTDGTFGPLAMNEAGEALYTFNVVVENPIENPAALNIVVKMDETTSCTGTVTVEEVGGTPFDLCTSGVFSSSMQSINPGQTYTWTLTLHYYTVGSYAYSIWAEGTKP